MNKDMLRVVRPHPILVMHNSGKLVHDGGYTFDPPARVVYEGMYLKWVGRGDFAPQEGWYDVPHRHHVTWIKGFTLVGESARCEDGTVCRVYKAEEGLPPREAIVPKRPPRGFKWRED